MCARVYVCIGRWQSLYMYVGGGAPCVINLCASLCVLLHKCEVCTVWGYVSVRVCVFDVYLPLVVFSAHAKRSGLSMPTLSHSTSETHILSDRKRQWRG